MANRKRRFLVQDKLQSKSDQMCRLLTLLSCQPPSHISFLLGSFASSITISGEQNFYRTWGLFHMTSLHIIIGKCVKSAVSISSQSMLTETHEVWSPQLGLTNHLSTGSTNWEEQWEQARGGWKWKEKLSRHVGNLVPHCGWHSVKHSAEPKAAHSFPQL